MFAMRVDASCRRLPIRKDRLISRISTNTGVRGRRAPPPRSPTGAAAALICTRRTSPYGSASPNAPSAATGRDRPQTALPTSTGALLTASAADTTGRPCFGPTTASAGRSPTAIRCGGMADHGVLAPYSGGHHPRARLSSPRERPTGRARCRRSCPPVRRRVAAYRPRAGWCVRRCRSASRLPRRAGGSWSRRRRIRG